MKGTTDRKEATVHTYIEMITTHHEGKHEKNDGMFRVRRYYYWPITVKEDPEDEDDPEPIDRFYDNIEMAKLDYMVYVAQQVAEHKLMEYVELDVYNEYTRFYEVIYASHQYHTLVSYGLDPNK